MGTVSRMVRTLGLTRAGALREAGDRSVHRGNLSLYVISKFIGMIMGLPHNFSEYATISGPTR
jgi:hypothetical protein